MKYSEDPMYPKPSSLTKEKQSDTALDKQIGGNHYKEMSIQPIEYIVKNNLGWCEGNIIKYITRHHQMGGEDDVRKVIHYCHLLMELHYPKNTKSS